MTTLQVLIVLCGLAAVLYGLVTSRQILSLGSGNDKMQEIAGAIQEGARAYLNRQYMTIAIVGVVIFALIWVVFDLASGIGFLIGVLPGAGATIASFLAYGMERNLVKDEEKEKFGKGSVNGLSAPETANNAACSGSFVPMLTLGIPGSGTTAVMLGALLGFGIQPGPRLYMTNPEIFWSVIMSMYIGMVILLILNLPLIPYIARILAVPKNYLIPLILFFSITGIYVMSFNNFDIYLMIGIAVVATFLRLYDFPMPPLILAFVLGGLMEENLRRSLLLSNGSWEFLWDRTLTVCILVTTILIVLWHIYKTLTKK